MEKSLNSLVVLFLLILFSGCSEVNSEKEGGSPAERKIVSSLGCAKNNIFIATNDISSRNVCEALIKAAGKGVLVYIFFEGGGPLEADYIIFNTKIKYSHVEDFMGDGSSGLDRVLIDQKIVLIGKGLLNGSGEYFLLTDKQNLIDEIHRRFDELIKDDMGI